MVADDHDYTRTIIAEILRGAGVREVFIVTGWKAEVIESWFGDGSRLGLKIAYGRQVVQDGTGKAPELAREWVGDSPFILTYGDILVFPETYQEMVRRFSAGGFNGVVTVTGSEDVTKGGKLVGGKKYCDGWP